MDVATAAGGNRQRIVAIVHPNQLGVIEHKVLFDWHFVMVGDRLHLHNGYEFVETERIIGFAIYTKRDP